MAGQFIHLNLHTEYSLIDSTIRIESLLTACTERGFPAVAVTDQQNFFALVKFYQAARNLGIKPLIGAELWLHNAADQAQPFHAIFLCKNKTGYHNLTKLISRSYLEGQVNGMPMIDRSWLAQANEGLIVLSGAQLGDVGQAICAGKMEIAEKLAKRWAELFPDSFYLELQRVGRENEEFYIQHALALAEKLSLPVVATNAVRFLNADDFTAHETRVCIHDGYTLTDERRPKKYTAQRYLRTPQEMLALFADIPSAIENTVEIGKRCNLTITLGQTFLPNYPIPAGMTMVEYFQQAAQQGLLQRLAIILDPAATTYPQQKADYQQRLDLELAVINQMGFTGYFLIVADFIQWAKDNDIPVGPGRGSGAGSLVAYALKITDLDPIEHGLLFERFLNPERVSMPDFDIDFCMEGRDRVIEYVADKYGHEAVSQIITYGTMAAKAVVRDVGRVLGHPYGFVDKLAKLIPFELGMTLTKAMQQEPRLAERYQAEDEVRELIDLALKLEGLIRNVGKHAGGVVIAPSKLTDFTPIYTESNGTSLVSQFDKDDVEAVGLVKFDFLGLRTLTIIDWAVKAINIVRQKNSEVPLDITRLPMDDKATYDLLKACNTTAVFQLESRGMKDLIKRLQPDCFADIVALVALFRPGPLQSGMVDDFINRKHGRAQVEYPHPALRMILQETYGTILYQEQVMQIAQILAGYSLGGADILRRAMGKKKPEEMAKQRAIFMAGAVNNKVEAHLAGQIFDTMEKFAAYGFNKSHSAAYALLSYQTAWLKTHYPAEFMAAVLSSDIDNTDKIVIFFDDAKAQGLTILPPDINYSEYKFIANEAKQIVFGLGAIKGVGAAALESILQNRESAGPFQNLFEFCQRIDLRKANRRVLEGLIKSGALDCFAQDRSVLLASLDKAIKLADQSTRDQDTGQADLFGASMIVNHVPEYIQVSPWSEYQRLEAEKESLGLYLSGHPLNRYKKELDHLVSSKIKDLNLNRERSLKIAGIITGIRSVSTRKGERMAIVTLDDHTGRTDVAVFPDMYQSARDILVVDNIVVIEGDVQLDRFTGNYRFNLRHIVNLEQARTQLSKGIVISLQQDTSASQKLSTLQQILLPYKGGSCQVFVDYNTVDASARINLGNEWRVKPINELLEKLKVLVDAKDIQILYK